MVLFKKSYKLLLFLIFIFQILNPFYIFSQPKPTNFYITAGKKALIEDGDKLYRSVYWIRFLSEERDHFYLRLFDADVGGMFDQIVDQTKTRFRLFGKGNIQSDIRSIKDPIHQSKPLIDLLLGKDPLYDNQWRTLGLFNLKDAQIIDSLPTFQLVVDGVQGGSFNLYKILVSSQEKENVEIESIKITTNVLSLFIPKSNILTTLISFYIPKNNEYLDIFNFDAEGMGEIFLQTFYRKKIPLEVSGNGIPSSSRIQFQENEKGGEGVLIIGGERFKSDYLQCWIYDETEKPVSFLLPPKIYNMNYPPDPVFTSVPLSERYSVLLDASQSIDPDGDEMYFQWFLKDVKIGEGPRIVHQFSQPGTHLVRLSVTDNSGFIANTADLTQKVKINQLPVASCEFSSQAIPGELLQFNASKSFDKDGKIKKYIWDFGDGEKASGKITQHAYKLAGRYTVTLRVEDNSQSFYNFAEKKANIWVNSPPVPILDLIEKAAVNEAIKMNGNRSIDSDGDIIRYVWDFGDGEKGEGAEVIHRFTQPGTYKVQLNVLDNANVSNSEQTTESSIIINAAPVAKAESKKVIAMHENTAFNASESFDSDGYITEYHWNMGDSTTKNGKSIIHSYDQPGIYIVKLRIMDNSGVLNNMDEIQYTLRVNYPPVPDAGGDQLVNISNVSFDASQSKDKDDSIIEYLWNFGDNSISKGLKTTHTYAVSGKYRVILTVKDGSGTTSAVRSDTVLVTINHPPVADPGMTQIVAVGEEVQFDGSFSSDPDGNIVSYEWELERGVIKTGKKISHTYEKPAIYQVLLKVCDNAGAEDTQSIEVIVNSQPVARINPLEPHAPGQIVQFDGSKSYDIDGEIVEAIWDFGDGSPIQKGFKVTHAYSHAGQYPVVLTVKDNRQVSNNTGFTTYNFSVNHTPTAVTRGDILTSSQKIEFDASKCFDIDNDPLSYYWDFGDGFSGSGKLIKHIYQKPGIYPVQLMVDDGTELSNSTSEAFLKVHINSSPQAVLDVPGEVNAGENVLFDGSMSIDPDEDLLRYIWDFGDGTSAEGVNPIHMYKKGGYFRVILTVMDNSGQTNKTGLAEKVVYVIDAPVANAGEDQIGYTNRPIFLDGSGSRGGNRPIKSYEWDFGDGHQGGGVHTSHSYNLPGIYKVRLKITVSQEGNSENSSEDEINVKILPSPVAIFKYDTIGSPHEGIHFNAGDSNAGTTKITQYLWDFGDDSTGEGQQVIHQYQNPGKYKVRLSITTDAEDDCNTAYTEHLVTINAKPNADFSIQTSEKSVLEISPYSVVTFNAHKSQDKDGYIKYYHWDFGDGETGKGVFIQHKYKQSGRYKITLLIEDNSGTSSSKDTATSFLEVVKFPIYTIQSPSKGYKGESITFTIPNPESKEIISDSLFWYFSDGDTLRGIKVTKNFQNPGKYQVQVFGNNCCSMAKDITIFDIPSVILPDHLIVDIGEELVINPFIDTQENIPLTYQWNLGDSTLLNQKNVRYVYKNPGEYIATLNYKLAEIKSSISRSDSVHIIVTQNPNAEIIIDPDALKAGGARDEILFTAVLKDILFNYIFQWDFGDGQTASGKAVYHTYQESGSYPIKLKIINTSQKPFEEYIIQRNIEVTSR